MPYYVYGVEDHLKPHIVPGPNGGDPETSMYLTGKFQWNTVPITDEDRANVHKTLTIKEIPKPLRNRPIDVACYSNFDWYISDRVKRKLEELGAGKNEFYPIEIIFECKPQPIEPFWLMMTMNQLDAMDVERTMFKGEFGAEAAKRAKFRPERHWGDKYPLTLKREEASKEHFWHGFHDHGGMSVFFCSDAFHDWTVEADVRGFEFYKCDVWPPLNS